MKEYNYPNERVLVCGGRNFSRRKILFNILDVVKPQSIIHGNAKGADKLGGQYALECGISCDVFPADWNRYGRGAGPLRNQQMLDEGFPTMVVAVDGGDGTKDMVRRARKAGIPITQWRGYRARNDKNAN